MNKKAIIAGVVAAGLGAWLWMGGDDESKKDAQDSVSLTDQIWIDKMPMREKDKVSVFAMISDANLGVFDKTSAYEGEFSLFKYRLRKGEATITMLQTDKRHKVSFKVSKGDCGRQFEYCLRVKGAPRGAKVYGTRSEWRIESGSDVHDLERFVKTLRVE